MEAIYNWFEIRPDVRARFFHLVLLILISSPILIMIFTAKGFGWLLTGKWDDGGSVFDE